MATLFLCKLPWRGILWKNSRSFGIRTNGRIYTRSYLQSSLSFSLSPYCIFIHLGIIISGIGIAISVLRSMDICRGRYFPKAIYCIHGARCWGVICLAHMLIMHRVLLIGKEKPYSSHQEIYYLGNGSDIHKVGFHVGGDMDASQICFVFEDIEAEKAENNR